MLHSCRNREPMANQLPHLRTEWALTISDLTHVTDRQISGLSFVSSEGSSPFAAGGSMTSEHDAHLSLSDPFVVLEAPPLTIGLCNITPTIDILSTDSISPSAAAGALLNRILPIARYLEHAHAMVSNFTVVFRSMYTF